MGSIQIAVGGEYFKLKGEGPSTAARDATRGQITGFSKRSRRRLLEKLSKIDQEQVAEFRKFITLTWPNEFPKNCDTWMKQRRAFIKRMKRAFNVQFVVWKLEPQQRLAPHFHLIVFTHDDIPVEWVAENWYDIAGGGDIKHLHQHQKPDHCTHIESWRGVKHYAAKYLGKIVEAGQLPEYWHGCRWWGSECKPPMDIVEAKVERREFFELRRFARKLLRKRLGRRIKTVGHSGITLYIPADLGFQLIDAARLTTLAKPKNQPTVSRLSPGGI